jgi:chemotaxis family two-component system sensor kinase Cph1
MMPREESPQTAVTAQNVDLSNCDREQVQFCEAIQPHGLLFVLSEPDFTIRRVSGNVQSMLGLAPQELLGRSIDLILGQEQTEQFRRLVSREKNLTSPPTCLLTAPVPGPMKAAHFFTHRNEQGVLIVELETKGQPGPVSPSDLYSEVRASMAELQRTDSVQSFFDLAVARIRRFTGYDRVLAYKFLEDGSGWVIAEDRQPGLESYVGLHYPASDIPEPARRLFSMKWISHLPDVDYVAVPLVAGPGLEPGRVDLSYSLLRSVSVMYSGYLKNMGVKSTMVLTLLKNGKLWGLISCMHHQRPKHIAFEHRTAAEFLAHLISLAMASKEELQDRDYAGELSKLHTTMMEQMLRHVNFQEGLLRHDMNLLSYFGASGAVIAVDGHLHRLGRTPDEEHLRALIAWLGDHMGQDSFATDRLSNVYPPAATFREQASGLLTLRLFAHKPHFILWFLPEVNKTVEWAGDPRKPVEISLVNGEERLMPRSSFALWKESVQGASRSWKDVELTAALDLRRAIVDVVLRKAEELARANEDLVRSNQELDAFSYIASHDLKEPLRGIHNYARFVLEDHGDKLDEDGKHKLQTMMKLTERMDELINGLLHYSRLGREELEAVPTGMATLVRRVVQSLKPRLEELRVEVRLSDNLPTLSVNPTMFQEVFANLMTNAMRYNDKPDKWIEIGVIESTVGGGTSPQIAQALTEGQAVVYVKDNGIGIPANRQDQIFQIFRRLHSRDAYGGGTGVGLTIAKKIVERHGGRLWVESEPAVGSTFFMALPTQRT